MSAYIPAKVDLGVEPPYHDLINHTKTLAQLLAHLPSIEQAIEVMKTYITPKFLLLFIFGLLIFVRGIKADEKEPPTTLQIGPHSPLQFLLTARN